jgi:hypothetical protein
MIVAGSAGRGETELKRNDEARAGWDYAGDRIAPRSNRSHALTKGRELTRRDLLLLAVPWRQLLLPSPPCPCVFLKLAPGTTEDNLHRGTTATWRGWLRSGWGPGLRWHRGVALEDGQFG